MSRQRRTISSPHGANGLALGKCGGVKGRSRRQPVRAAQPLRPSPLPSALEMPCDRPACDQRVRGASAPRDARPFEGSPGASRLLGGRCRPHARADGSARMRPGALAPSSAPPTVACDPRSCRAEWSDLVERSKWQRGAIGLHREPPVRIIHHLDLLARQAAARGVGSRISIIRS